MAGIHHPQPHTRANPALLLGFSSGSHRNPGTGHWQHRLSVFLQQSASSDPSQALCLDMWSIWTCGETPEPQAALTRGGSGLLLLCSDHEMVSLSWLAGVFLQGVCCTTEDLFHGNMGLWGVFSCIHVRFIVILVNCLVWCQLWILLQRSSVSLDKCWHCSDYPQRIHIATCQKLFSTTAALKA